MDETRSCKRLDSGDSNSRRATTRVYGCVVAAGLALAWHSAALAQVYSGTSGESGAVVLSNFQSSDAPDILIARPEAAAPVAAPAETAAARDPVALSRPKASPELNLLIQRAATEAKVSADLLHAVITVESNYDLKARSPKGAIGLMQLLPATAKRFGAKDPYAASDNLAAGAGYLKWLMALFHDDLPLVLAAYNAGEQAVIKAGHKIPPFPETQAYVPRVLAQLQSAAKSPR